MMNPGQEQFYKFILERVQAEHLEAVAALLQENFKKQSEGSFNREDMVTTQAALMKMLKPEAVDEVKAAMLHFASQMK